MDRGRRARSGKINNSLEIESCADENCIFVRFLIKFWVFLFVFSIKFWGSLMGRYVRIKTAFYFRFFNEILGL